MKFLNKSTEFTTALLIVLFVFCGAFPGRAEMLDRVVAKVNDDIITLSEVQERAFIMKMRGGGGGKTDGTSEGQWMKRALETLLEESLIIQEGKKLNIAVDEGQVNQALDDIKSENNLTDASLEAMLKMEGRTMAQYKGHIRNQILVSRVMHFELRNKVKVSEREIKKYYRAHQKDYWLNSKIRARHILFILDDRMTPEQKKLKHIRARVVLKKLKEGQDFVELARKYSEDVSASSGGDLGEIQRGTMVPEFEQTAFKLGPGEVSDIVETPYGLHIIKTDKIIPGRTKPLKDVREEIERIILNQKQKKGYKAWVDELKKKAFIVVHLQEDPDKNHPAEEAGETARLPDSATSLEEGEFSGEEASSDTLSGPSAGSSDEEVHGSSSSYDALERKLRYIKKLRARHKISEEDYHKRKKKILDQL